MLKTTKNEVGISINQYPNDEKTFHITYLFFHIISVLVNAFNSVVIFNHRERTLYTENLDQSSVNNSAWLQTYWSTLVIINCDDSKIINDVFLNTSYIRLKTKFLIIFSIKSNRYYILVRKEN